MNFPIVLNFFNPLRGAEHETICRYGACRLNAFCQPVCRFRTDEGSDLTTSRCPSCQATTQRSNLGNRWHNREQRRKLSVPNGLRRRFRS